MYLKFKSKNRTFEDRIPFDNLTRISSGNGWLTWANNEEKGLFVKQAVFGKDEMAIVSDISTLYSESKVGDFVNFIILTDTDDVRHSYAWDIEEWDVFQENDDGKTVARY